MVEAEVSQAGSGDNQVLIVDDMRLNRQILGQMILEMGLEAVFAETGEEAVAKYTRH